MKIRADFVTNSSSSSFIISNQKFSNKEDMYLKIKSLFIEYFQKAKDVIEYCRRDNRFEIIENNGYIRIAINSEKAGKPPYFKIWDEIEEKFGLELYSIPSSMPKWIKKCKTYEQFVAYFEDDKYSMPFTLIDVFNKSSQDEEDVCDILKWYFPCFNSEYDDIDCKYCHEKSPINCEKAQKTKTEKEMFEFMKSNIIVFSEDGHLPNFIVKELSKISNLYCNHMG